MGDLVVLVVGDLVALVGAVVGGGLAVLVGALVVPRKPCRVCDVHWHGPLVARLLA